MATGQTLDHNSIRYILIESHSFLLAYIPILFGMDGLSSQTLSTPIVMEHVRIDTIVTTDNHLMHTLYTAHCTHT